MEMMKMSDIPSPISATEKYLSKMAGSYSGDLPSPANRDEIFMYYAAINSGGGGGGGGGGSGGDYFSLPFLPNCAMIGLSSKYVRCHYEKDQKPQ